MAYTDKRKLKNDLNRRYNISVAVYEAMMEGVGRKCMICSRHEEDIDTLCIDHCHDTGKIRGCICKICNWGLQNFQDDPELLRKAARYLEDDMGD